MMWTAGATSPRWRLWNQAGQSLNLTVKCPRGESYGSIHALRTPGISFPLLFARITLLQSLIFAGKTACVHSFIMRTFIFAAAAVAGVANASQSWAGDVTVTATATRTHTFCPVTPASTCGAAAATTDVSGIHGGHGFGNGGEAGSAWFSKWQEQKSDYGIWSDWSSSAPETAAPTTTAGSGSGGSDEGGSGGHGGSSYSYSTSGSGLGTSSDVLSYTTGGSVSPTSSVPYSSHSTSTSSSATSTTSSSSCPTYVPPVNATDDICNSAADRSYWCDKKSTSTDYYNVNYHTGVTREYTFTITNTTLFYDGTGPKLALAINGQVPGPVVEANWGDIVKITVINNMPDNSTAIHWHGIRQLYTNDQDGVPGVTECAIAGNGGSRTYTWHASSYGTSWYHSHAFAQYGDGIRGPIVIHGPATANYDYDMGTVMIDDT